MNRKLTPPMSQIPIGVVDTPAGRLEVKQHPEFTRFFFDLFARVGGVQGQNVEDLLNCPPTAELDATALTQPAQLAEQIAQLREQVAELSKTDIETQLAQLREQVAYMGLKRKRNVQSSIAIGAGTASATYTISPAVASVDLCDLAYLGATATAAAGTTDACVSLELTNTSTITARRIGTAGTATVYFILTEFTQ